MVITSTTSFKMLIKDQTQTGPMLPECCALALRDCLSCCLVLLIVSLQSGGTELRTGSTQMTTHTHTLQMKQMHSAPSVPNTLPAASGASLYYSPLQWHALGCQFRFIFKNSKSQAHFSPTRSHIHIMNVMSFSPLCVSVCVYCYDGSLTFHSQVDQHLHLLSEWEGCE